MHFTRALVRRPGPELVHGQALGDLGRVDVERALAQHAAYVAALRALGLAVLELPAEPGFPDACFVEDTAIVTAAGSFLTRPGHPARAGETASIAPVLARECPPLTEMPPPGRLDGGDVLDLPDRVLIGLSARTDATGAEALASWLRAAGRRVEILDVQGVPGLLHLKTGASWLGERRLAVIPSFAGHPALAGYECLVVDVAEAYAANCLRMGDAVVLPAGYPRFARAVADIGLRVVALEMSEFVKVDGGLSCLSLRW